jgi:hypothetical protein
VNVALARTQLRGLYAIAAGFLLLLGVPLFQGVFLAPNGYIEATDAVVRHVDFGPLLLWTSQHAGIATVFHLLELVSFLLVLGLPGALRRVLWGDPGPGGLAMLASGTLGFAAYAVAIVIGIVAGISAANTYASSPQHSQAAIARSYASTYAFSTLLSQVIGGILVALCVGLASVRIIRTRTLLTWIGYFGLLFAALLILTAVQFSSQLTQAETTLSPFTFATFALWLVCIGVQLAGLRRMPDLPGMPGMPDSAAPPPLPTDASRNSDDAPNHQSAGQLPPG